MLGSRFNLSETVAGFAQRGAGPSAKGGDGAAQHGDELERQIADVVSRWRDQNSRTRFSCPVCGSGMQLGAARVMSEFGLLGIERHDLECDTCGLVTRRAYHASHGYQDMVL